MSNQTEVEAKKKFSFGDFYKKTRTNGRLNRIDCFSFGT